MARCVLKYSSITYSLRSSVARSRLPTQRVESLSERDTEVLRSSGARLSRDDSSYTTDPRENRVKIPSRGPMIEVSQEATAQHRFVGSDGVFIALGPQWSDEAMTYEREERG